MTINDSTRALIAVWALVLRGSAYLAWCSRRTEIRDSDDEIDSGCGRTPQIHRKERKSSHKRISAQEIENKYALVGQ